MALFDNLRKGLSRSREALSEIFYMGGEVDEEFWENLEDTLVMADMGAEVAMQVSDDLREQAARENLRTARQMREALAKRLAEVFPRAERDPFKSLPSCVVFVGIKLQVWGQRAGVEVVTRERGGDPASVCYDVLDRAEREGTELVLIDTAGRLHTSPELMRELAKVVAVSRKRATMPVTVVLVIDATTGQNGLNQAREFNDALDIDGLIVTKLDGTAKGGIALAISHELNLPIYRIGVGEGKDDLQAFDALDFCRALVGETEGI